MKLRNSILLVSGAAARGRAGFSLVEILMAVMILGVGMIMIASVFPVGANWARQNIEETIGSIVAKNAVGIIQTRYTAANLDTVDNTIQAIPGIVGPNPLLPLVERAYAFGKEPAYPATDPTNANYFWTALIRRSGGANSTSDTFDLYILVFNRNDPNQIFRSTNSDGDPFPSGVTEVTGARALTNELNIPCVIQTPTVDRTGENTFLFPLPPIQFGTVRGLLGSQLIEQNTGNVYRVIDNDYKVNSTLPSAANPISFFHVPPADDGSVSPLVYIYQTTISF